MEPVFVAVMVIVGAIVGYRRAVRKQWRKPFYVLLLLLSVLCVALPAHAGDDPEIANHGFVAGPDAGVTDSVGIEWHHLVGVAVALICCVFLC